MKKRLAKKILKAYDLMAAPERHHPHQIKKAQTVMSRRERRSANG